MMSGRLLFYALSGTFFFIPLSTSLTAVMGTAALAVWLFSGRFVKDRACWAGEGWVKPVVLFMLLPVAGLLWGPDIAAGADFVKKGRYWLYAFVIASIAPKAQRKAMLGAFLAGLSLNAGYSLLQAGGVLPMTSGMATGFLHRGHIAYSLLLVFGMLLLSFYFKGSGSKGARMSQVLLIGVYFASLASVPGRIGYLAFVFLSPWILYNILGKRLLLVSAGVVILGVVLFSSPVVRQRTGLAAGDIKAYEAGDKTTSLGLRFYMGKGAIKVFLENPILGTGTGGYKSAMQKYREPGLPDVDHPHNSFLYMAVSFGLIGLMSLSWLFYAFLKKGWQARATAEGFAVLSFGVVIFIGSMTDAMVISAAPAQMFALLSGLRTD